MMSINWTKGALLTATVLFGMQAPAFAESNGTVEYRIQRGDTLVELARDYFVNARAIKTVMTLNNIRNPRRLQIGKSLTVPRDVLRYKSEPLRVQAFSGPVTISRQGQAAQPEIGDIVAQGAVISTGRKGFISLVGTGNSRISIPSNSSVRLSGAKRYLINDAIDFDVRVLRGRSEVKAPTLKGEERYRVGTPRAVTAVRGTEFRVAFDEGLERSLTEVTEGEVLVASGTREVATPAGLGVATSANGLGTPETLLNAPELVDPTSIRTDAIVQFQAKPLEAAKAYRTQIARDAGFLEIIAEDVSEDGDITFDDLDDGRLFVRSRGIAESGLEGFSNSYNFRRKRLGVTGGVEPSPFADAFKFVWLPEGEGNSFGAFQLWDTKAPDVLLVDEVGLETNGFYVSNLEPGSYKWRVATFQIDEGETIKVWAPAQEFTVSD
ncbi:LysM peptidoglycan-binding domain-containing protein [Erythrobacter insulae]|uniref:LysM peptidoglycan-binding domain-containing protein n=1 Tax=Erythrobacter insulae TaxID=2584124 RepID=A0A547PCS6_9SPHN|nr:FecR domain-containing protein [Erythrobacter insulae]TRD11942.1 LysM peptidoglycan-binding domain-containing protein [Erythrobacter insulae]